MGEENIGSKNKGGTRKSFIEKINQTGLMKKKHTFLNTALGILSYFSF